MLDDITQSVVDRIGTNLFSSSSSFFQLVGTPNYFASINRFN